MSIEVHGEFPFGRPNTPRPMRAAPRDAQALVVGVYPSAFHVAWRPPSEIDPRSPAKRRGWLIGSLAVDVEPTVFWDGTEPGPGALLEQWKNDVGFDDELHGTVALGTNGPSGAGVGQHVLAPLGIDRSAVAFTDVLPWYFVKNGARSQGAAIRDRFRPLADELRVAAGSLPPRPSARELVQLASSEPRRESLRQEIVESGASLVITLGQEALDAVRAVADASAGGQAKLAPMGYGTRGELTIGSTEFELLPLAHPGFIRQTRSTAWRAAIDAWTARGRSAGV